METKSLFFRIVFVLLAIAIGVSISQIAKGAPTHEQYTNAVRIVREYRKAHPVKPRRVVRPSTERRPGQFKAFNLKGGKRYNPITKKLFIEPKKDKKK